MEEMRRDKQELSNHVRRLINSDLDLSYDTEAKNLFGNKEVLSVIAKYVIPEVKDYSYEEIAAMIGNVNISKEEIAVNGPIERLESESKYVGEKTIFYDIKTTIHTNDGAIELILNVEIQRRANPGYNLKMRGSYYVSRAFSEQLKDISDDASYDKLKKVYSVWIVSNSPKEEIVKYSFMNTKTRTIDPKNDPFSLIMIYLGKQQSKKKVIRYIKALFERDMDYLKKYYHINEEMERSMESMCNLSEGIREESIELGKKLGKEEGKLEGKLEGREEGKLEAAKIMIENGMDLEFVAEKLSLEKELVEKFLENTKE